MTIANSPSFEDLYCVLPEEIPLSHVLLGGDEQQVTTMHALLTQWGVTASRLASLAAVPTVLDCDAVILQGDFLHYRDTNLGCLPDGTGGAVGPAAPLIFINEQDVDISPVPANWQIVNQVDSDGAALHAALWSAFGLAESLRGAVDNDSYLQFLGHEMRSPLTALKTSLDELAQVMQKSSEDELKMLAIARRNVQRLHETVEWNQEMLSAHAAAESVKLRTSSIASLARYLAEADHDICMNSQVMETTLETDYNLVDKLLCQMTRVLELVCPETALDVKLFHGAETGDRICLQVAPESSRAIAASIARQRNLISHGETTTVTDELERLTQIVVADCLVAAIGAELKTIHTENEAPALVLTLPTGANSSIQ